MAKKKDKREEHVEEGKVIKTVPRNMFSEDQWPDKKGHFMNRAFRPVPSEDGSITYQPNGFTYGDFPTYVKDSYCYHRVCKEMGLAPQDNMVAAVYDGRRFWQPIFQSDEEDNIIINFWNLDRELIQLNDTHRAGTTEQMSDNKKDPGTYSRVRLNPKNATESQKYESPRKEQSSTNYPFIPPQLVELWERREKIKTLVVTEGEFKAMKACMCGAHVVGIGGIQMFANTETHDVHTDILRLVKDCEVENLVFLHDGDCTNISKSALESKDGNGQPDKDIAKRPLDFMQSAKNFYRLYHKAMPKVKIFWQYINSKAIPHQPKGLDDLLLAMPNETARIVEEMENPDSVTVFFHRVNMGAEIQRLQEHFFLDSVANFYKHHKEQIDPEPDKGQPKVHHLFLWMGTLYRWNETKKECEEILSRDMMAYQRIGTSWYKITKRPTAGKDKDGNIIFVDVLTPWSRQNITDDFGTEVLGKLHRYDGFINLPSHDNYHRVIGNYYNMYHPLPYKPNDDDLKKNGFPYIYSTMEHIFGKDNRSRGLKPGDEGYDKNSQFDIGCDYMQLLYLHPTQNLPILCLVSSERGTGKTSFLDLLQAQYAENCVIVGNEQMESNFNGLVGGRLVVGVDESELADNKKFTEKLKFWSTTKRLPVEKKGKDAEMVDNYTKYILTSNNETRFIYASDKEVRFWVRKIPKLPEGEKVGNIIPFFEKEMPAFLAWLNQRDMYFAPDDPTKIDRMYFPPDMLHTEWLDNLLEAQRPRAERKMRDWLKQWFIDFGKKELLTTAEKLQEAISTTDKKFANFDLDDLKRYIEENMGVQKYGGGSGKSKRFNYSIIASFISDSDKESGVTYTKIQGNGRPYQFFAKDFMSDTEYRDLFPDGDDMEPDHQMAEQAELFEDEDNDRPF